MSPPDQEEILTVFCIVAAVAFTLNIGSQISPIINQIGVFLFLGFILAFLYATAKQRKETPKIS